MLDKKRRDNRFSRECTTVSLSVTNKENLTNHKNFDMFHVLKENMLLEENGDIYGIHMLQPLIAYASG